MGTQKWPLVPCQYNSQLGFIQDMVHNYENHGAKHVTNAIIAISFPDTKYGHCTVRVSKSNSKG